MLRSRFDSLREAFNKQLFIPVGSQNSILSPTNVPEVLKITTVVSFWLDCTYKLFLTIIIINN